MKNYRHIQRSIVRIDRILLVMIAFVACIRMSATDIIQTEHLTFYYPNFNSIDLSLEKMPDMSDTKVEFCCEAAFTGQRLSSFRHSNVADNHVSGGK